MSSAFQGRARSASARHGFTLIELLTVIAIIAVLAAILFPLAGTVREQSRQADCMSKLHQLYVSASVYRADEGAYPATLLGFAEIAQPGSNGTVSTGTPYTAASATQPVSAERVINGFLYSEQIRDINLFKCTNNPNASRSTVTFAHLPQPTTWAYGGANIPWQQRAANVCPSDSFGIINCYTSGPPALIGQPKYYYIHDSYSIGPRVDAAGRPVRTPAGQVVYDVHYSPDWTGVTGAADLPSQLKYENPPSDRTLLTYCTWHAFAAGSPNAPGINLAGTARKLNMQTLLRCGPNVFYQRDPQVCP